MRVLHIIPLAFDYFNDIAQVAFKMVDGLEEAGVNVDVITLQYTKPTREQQTQVAEAAPSRGYEYVEQQPVEQVVKSVKEEDFQLVHLHCPFFGAGKDWLRFKRDNPEFPLVVTYHHDLPLTDLFSVYVKMYNRFYVPRFFSAADVVTCVSRDAFCRSLGWRYLRQKEKLITLLSDPDRQTNSEDASQLLSDEKNMETAVGGLIDIYSKLRDGYRLV